MQVKPEAPRVVAALHRMGLRVWMMTGDNPRVAHALAARLGIPPQRVVAGRLTHTWELQGHGWLLLPSQWVVGD